MKIQSVANWGPDLLPLEEWDGVIYVACVEPPEDIRWSFPVQYVLASPRDLKIQWERLNSEPTRMGVSLAELEENTSPGITSPQIHLNLNLPDIGVSALPMFDAPEGFKLNLPPSSIEAPPPPTPAAAVDQPEGLNLNFVGKPENTSSGFTLVPTPAKPAAPAASASAGSIDADRIAPTSIDTARTENEAIAWVFQQLKQHFRNSWLLVMTGDTLKAWRWDSVARPASPEAEAAIDLSQPSLFRIVARTAMPYHGHVVESAINNGFFRAWGLRNTPPHVTAVPVLSNGHLVAILLCSGDKPAQPDLVLRFSEKMANAIALNLGRKAAA